MKHCLAVILAISVSIGLDALAQGPLDLNSGSRLSSGSGPGSFNFSWWGVSGYTYLIKTSDDLHNWSYIPIVESGSDAVIEWGFSSNSSGLFLKLEYITVPASQLTGTVFNGTLDTNGLPEDWELFFFGYLAVDPNMDPNGEGFTALQDYQNGNNPIANQVVSVGPRVGEYLFHETSGITAHDISSLHNNGTLSGGAAWSGTDGYDGRGSIIFDGTSGEVTISDTGNQVLPAAGAPFSFAFWFNANATSLSGTTTLITDEIAGASGFEFGIDSTGFPPNLVFSTPGSAGIQLEAWFQPGVWTEAAVTYDGTTATIYVNGYPEASGTGTLVSNTNSILLANGLSGTQPFAGAMEDLTFYRASLQQSDVSNLYTLSTTSTGPDSSGIANWWKYLYFGTLNVNPNALAARGDGLTILQAYQDGDNPNDFYNGQLPSLSFVSGAGQRGAGGAFLPQPLAVAVNYSEYNAPLTLTVTSGHALLASSTTSTPSASVQVRSVSQVSGRNAAAVYVLLPTTVGDASTIQATATSGSSSVSVNATVAVIDPSLQPPQNFTAVPTSPTSAQLSWTPSDATLPTTVQKSSDNGLTWATIQVVPAGATQTTVGGLLPQQPVQLRLYTGSDN